MNPRATGFLFLLAAALAAFVYLYEVRGGEQRKEAEQVAKRMFPGVQASDVAWIVLTTNDGSASRVERKDGAWQVVEPVAFPGDAVNLDGISASLVDLTSEKEIEGAQAPEVYGIDATSRVVRFGAGGKEYELRLGKKSPVGSSTYAATGEQPGRVVTIPTYRATNLERSLDDLRERRILNFDRTSIVAIEVRWPEGHASLERSDAGWKLLEPISGPADEATVDTLLSNLGYLRADSFEDAPGSDARTGLDRPAFEVTLSGKAGVDGKAPPVFHLVFGAEENGKRLVRALQPSLYRVAAQRLEELPRTLAAYRFKELARFVATDAKTVELALRDDAGSLLEEKIEQGDAGWTGSPEAVDPGKAARLVAELARLRGSDIASESASETELAKLGLEPPRARIRVLGAAAGEIAPALLGAVDVGADPDGKGPYARTPSSSVVYRLAPTVKDWLPTSPESFRSVFTAKPAPQSEPALEGESPDASDAAASPDSEGLSGE